MANAQQQRRVKTAREMAMPQGIEPLHLTEENKEDIRRLVRKITPHFEAELWAKVNLQKAADEEKRRSELEQLAEQKRQWAMAQQQAAQMPSVPYLGGLGVINSLPQTPGGVIYQQATGSPIYTSSGTGFTSYGPIDQLQGLTLSKSMENAINTLNKHLP